MANPSIQLLLADWRSAERRWELHGSPDEVRLAADAVVRAWVAYQDATIPRGSGEFMLVAGDDQTYVAATAGVTEVSAMSQMNYSGLGSRTLRLRNCAELRPGSGPNSWPRADRMVVSG